MKSCYLITVCAALLALVGVTVAQSQPRLPSVPSVPVPVVPSHPEPLPSPVGIPAPSTPRTDPLVGAPALPQRTGANSDPLVTAPARRQQVADTKPESLTIDELIEAVDEMRELKTELEKKERAYLKVLHRKAEKQKERIDGLGGDGHGTPPAMVPPAVGPSTSFAAPVVP